MTVPVTTAVLPAEVLAVRVAAAAFSLWSSALNASARLLSASARIHPPSQISTDGNGRRNGLSESSRVEGR